MRRKLQALGGRYRVVVLHLLVLSALCFLDGPFQVRWNALLRRVSRLRPDTICEARSSDGTSMVLQKMKGKTVVEARELVPESGGRIYVQTITKRELGFWDSLVRKMLSHAFWGTFEQFGVVYMGILLCIVIRIMDPKKARYIWLLVASAVSAVIVVWFVQHTVGKIRPLHTSGFPEFVRFPEGWKKSTSYSMPSGHTTFVFVLATFISFLYPRLRVVAFTVACMVGAQRIISMNHWLSDVYVGALVGNTVTRLWIRRILRGQRTENGGRRTEGESC